MTDARTRAVAVAMVKNECDVIELFVRINLRAFDRLHVVDHASSDATPAILARLQAEGLPLTVSHHAGIHQTQAEVLTQAMREAAARGDCGYVVPLDADEFFQPPAGFRWSDLDATLGDARYGRVPWTTFVPVAGGYFDVEAPLHALFRRREREPAQFHKVVVPRALAATGTILAGSHGLRGDIPHVELPLELLHVPVRSGEQLLRKALVGSRTLSIKPNRAPGEGFHWDMLAERIRSAGYRLADSDLRDLALGYALDAGVPLPAVSVDDRRIGRPDDRIRHRDLARIDPLAAVDAFLGQACAEINALNAALADATARRPSAWVRFRDRVRGR